MMDPAHEIAEATRLARRAAVLGKEQLSPQDYRAVAKQMTEIILRGCGLTPPA